MKKKAAVAKPAGELYLSPLFLGRRAYVQRSCDFWYILSAKHGLLRPTDVVEPYDRTLDGAPKAEKVAWSRQVVEALAGELGKLTATVFEVHAGAAYRDFGLVAGLMAKGATVEVPALGLSQGKQLSFYLHGPAPKPPVDTEASSHRASGGQPGALTTWLLGASPPVTLSFLDVEHILGRSLPASARKHRAFWANSPSQTVSQQWLTAGWRAEKVDMAAEQIVLVR